MSNVTKSTVNKLTDLLERAALLSPVETGITYASADAGRDTNVLYRELLRESYARAALIHKLLGTSKDRVVVLHFDSHRQNIEWFWAVVIAGYLPAMSIPFTNHAPQRRKHLCHLRTLLRDPLVLSREGLSSQFDADANLDVCYVDGLEHEVKSYRLDTNIAPAIITRDEAGNPRPRGVLMLTSGSTGNSKAVSLTQEHIVHALVGKALCHKTTSDDVFLNWVGLDHVAGLVESHLLAMYHCAPQVHMQAVEVVANPISLLTAIDRFGVSITFAPNFFLAKLETALAAGLPEQLDLSCLRHMISGGESNTIGTAVKLLDHLVRHGAPRRQSLIQPGFGMTETCAGAMHHPDFPDCDIARGRQFASLGVCHKGISMRVRRPDGSRADPGEPGALEVCGPLVLKEYFNNPEATQDAFTDDGWFITGDTAAIDDQGMLCLAGRTQETLNINDVKQSADEVEQALEEARIAGLLPSYAKVFSVRPEGAATEGVGVVYAPSYGQDNDGARFDCQKVIGKLVQLLYGVTPLVILPVPAAALNKSSLGKLSRAKIKASYEQGEYAVHEAANRAALARHKALSFKGPKSETEAAIRDIVAELVGTDAAEVDVASGLLETGVSSVEVIKFKQLLQAHFDMADIPTITIIRTSGSSSSSPSGRTLSTRPCASTTSTASTLT